MKFLFVLKLRPFLNHKLLGAAAAPYNALYPPCGSSDLPNLTGSQPPPSLAALSTTRPHQAQPRLRLVHFPFPCFQSSSQRCHMTLPFPSKAAKITSSLILCPSFSSSPALCFSRVPNTSWHYIIYLFISGLSLSSYLLHEHRDYALVTAILSVPKALPVAYLEINKYLLK